jgi:multidrug resistance efflux pump
MSLQVLGELPEHSHEHDHSDIRAEVMRLQAEIAQLKAGQIVQQVEIAVVAAEIENVAEQAEEASEQAQAAEEIAVEAVINSVDISPPVVDNPIEEEEHGERMGSNEPGTEESTQRESEDSASEEERGSHEPVILQLEPERQPVARHPEQSRRATRFTRGR